MPDQSFPVCFGVEKGSDSLLMEWVLSGAGSPKGIDAMHRVFRASALVPRGFVVEDATRDDGDALITVRSVAEASVCPGCGTPVRAGS